MKYIWLHKCDKITNFKIGDICNIWPIIILTPFVEIGLVYYHGWSQLKDNSSNENKLQSQEDEIKYL